MADLLPGFEPKQFIFVKIFESIGPLERQEKYGEALDIALKGEEVGEVSGGGTMLSAPDADGRRQTIFIGLDVDLVDFDRGLPLLKRELIRLQVSKTTVLEYTRHGFTYSDGVYDGV